MSMSTRVIGFAPPDERWQKMKAIYDAYQDAGLPKPDEILDFFNHEPPDIAGVEVELPTTSWNDEHSEGFELRVEDIPPNVKVIRFVNSW